MKQLFISLLVLGLSAWLGSKLMGQANYLLIHYYGWVVRLPLLLAAITTVLGYALVRSLLKPIIQLFRLPKRISSYLEEKRHQKAERLYIQNLLTPLYQLPPNWSHILCSLEPLQKKGLISHQDAHNLTWLSYKGLLKEAVEQADLSELQKIWGEMPRKWRFDPALLASYTMGLIQHKQHDQAEYWIRKTLNKCWDTQLVETYGLIETAKPEKQLKIAESWLVAYPEDANLLLSLGKLCERMQLWGKAEDYLKASLSCKVKPETYRSLGRLYEKLGDKQRALDFYKKIL